jgi:(p)ppGpp synthase/HD superfamily hydrolase
MVLDPKKFAAWAHAGQMYGPHPYTQHLDEVADIASVLADNMVSADVLEAVGYLHDVIEETPVTRLFLDEMFGGVKAKAVALLTDPDLPTRREKKAELHRRLKHLDENDVASRAALLVKLADRLANVKACVRNGNSDKLRMYAREHEAFRDAVHREGLCSSEVYSALWWELDKHLT